MNGKVSISIELSPHADPKVIGQAIALLISQMETPEEVAQQLQEQAKIQLAAFETKASDNDE